MRRSASHARPDDQARLEAGRTLRLPGAALTRVARLLEVGAGTGQDAVFFRDNGMDVVATDLTPEMVDRCARRGSRPGPRTCSTSGSRTARSTPSGRSTACSTSRPIRCRPRSPRSRACCVRTACSSSASTARMPPSEGVNEDDNHDPKRFFAFRPDDVMLDAVARTVRRRRLPHVRIRAQTRDRTFRFQSFTAVVDDPGAAASELSSTPLVRAHRMTTNANACTQSHTSRSLRVRSACEPISDEADERIALMHFEQRIRPPRDRHHRAIAARRRTEARR